LGILLDWGMTDLAALPARAPGKYAGRQWWKNFPKLQPTGYFPPRIVEHPKGSGKLRKRWGNQTDAGQNKLAPSDDRWKLRSTTYQGIAERVRKAR